MNELIVNSLLCIELKKYIKNTVYAVTGIDITQMYRTALPFYYIVVISVIQ